MTQSTLGKCDESIGSSGKLSRGRFHHIAKRLEIRGDLPVRHLDYVARPQPCLGGVNSDKSAGGRELWRLRGQHRRLDADQLALRIHECAAGVSGIDRGVSLDEQTPFAVRVATLRIPGSNMREGSRRARNACGSGAAIGPEFELSPELDGSTALALPTCSFGRTRWRMLLQVRPALTHAANPIAIRGAVRTVNTTREKPAASGCETLYRDKPNTVEN